MTDGEINMPKSDTTDSNLPAVTASLEMLTVNANLSGVQENRRTLRKRISRVIPNENLNRRCNTRPKKRTYSEMDTEEDVTEYYLDKTIKNKKNNLETIYEEKDGISENSVYMSAKRYKRMIQFQEAPSDSKLKKRKAKIKKLFGSKINYKRRYASMQMLLDKLNGIKAESSAKTENEVK